MRFIWILLILLCSQVSAISYYGPGLNSDGLANLEVGKTQGREVAYRFRAQESGEVESGLFYFVHRPGYGSGDGGIIKVELRLDDEVQNTPSDVIIATEIIENPMDNNFPEIQFDPSPTLNVNQIYHIVFSNIDDNPEINYVSTDEIYNSIRQPNMQPTYDDIDLATLWKPSSSSEWVVNYGHTPIFELTYSSGNSQGVGYVDAFSSSGVLLVSDAKRLAEIFTVSETDRSLNSMHVRMSGTSSGTLVLTLADSSGNIMAQEKLPSQGEEMSWYDVELSSQIDLKRGETYRFIVSSITGAFSTFGMQEGSSWGFSPNTFFSDGHMEYDDGNGLKTYRDGDTDLQFYFVVDDIFDNPDVCGPGDANCDGIVDLSDLIMVGVDYSKTSDFKPGADLDKDGVIGLGDLVLIGLNYGKVY